MVPRPNYAGHPELAARFHWGAPLYAGLAGLALFVAIEICPVNTAVLLYILAVPILIMSSVVLLICATIDKNRRRYLTPFLTLMTFLAAGVGVFIFGIKYPLAIRSAARWLIWSKDYETLVLTQPSQPNGEFKHIEWDGWGMFGQDESVFLVFDPGDSLAGPASSGQSGKFDGIPCEVGLVRRLAPHWYTVYFPSYVDMSSWDRCS